MKKITILFTLVIMPFIMMAQKQDKPNILVIWGDDIGWSNPSIYNRGMMGYKTPNIDKIGNDGIMFTDYYSQQSCTAGRAAFITGQSPYRTGLTKVAQPELYAHYLKQTERFYSAVNSITMSKIMHSV